MNNIPLSLYIHIPWCIRKCPYCDFNSHPVRKIIPQEEYIEALIQDLENDLEIVKGRELISIFIGGGTPSLFDPDLLQRLLKNIQERLPFATNIEITLEANPGTVEQDRFEGFINAGLNRLSIGCQSFQDRYLKSLERIHSAEEARKAIQEAKKAGFKNINVDLMFGLPHQTVKDAITDLNSCLQLNPNHISWYQLTLEPNTRFYRNPPTCPPDEELWQMQKQGVLLLKNSGFEHYEVSAYAKHKYQCLHNRHYWEFGDYLGIGAGAHSKITNSVNKTITRFYKYKHPKQYLKNSNQFVVEKEIIQKNQLPFEFMLNALRLQEPISKNLFENRTGLNFSVLTKELEEAEAKGLLTIQNEYIEPTELGRRFLDDLVQIFIQADNQETKG